MADLGSDFDGPLAQPPPEERLVVEVEPPGVYGDFEMFTVFRDHGGGNMEPVSWPDDWPMDITLDQLRERGVRVVGE